MSNYELWLTDVDGNREELIPFISLEYTRRTNTVTNLKVEVEGNFDVTMLAEDKRLEVWRDGALHTQTCWFIRRWVKQLKNGVKSIFIYGMSANCLLKRRDIMYAAGSSYADKSNYLDLMMCEIVDENFVTPTDTTREMPSFLVDTPALGSGSVAAKSFAWRNVDNVLNDICQLSEQLGLLMYYDVIYNTTAKDFTFKTYTNQRGNDLTGSVIFSDNYGNLDNVTLEYDATEEVTYVKALGQGEGADRLTKYAQNATRIAISPFGLMEKAQDARNNNSANGVQSEADQTLTERKPRQKFSADLIDVGFVFETDYTWGDKVMVYFENVAYECLIESISVTLSGGRETIKAGIKIL